MYFELLFSLFLWFLILKSLQVKKFPYFLFSVKEKPIKKNFQKDIWKTRKYLQYKYYVYHINLWTCQIVSNSEETETIQNFMWFFLRVEAKAVLVFHSKKVIEYLKLIFKETFFEGNWIPRMKISTKSKFRWNLTLAWNI